MLNRIALGICVLFAACSSAQEPASSLVPAPVHVFPVEGTFTLDVASTIILAQPTLKDEGEFLRDGLKSLLGLQVMLLPDKTEKPRSVHLAMAKRDSVPAEGYTLVIGPERIDITGADEAGVFHGIISLLNMMRLGDKASPSLACRTITDFPRFAWRGMHLDVSRHFFPVDFVKRYIDLLARYKMNRFHWHLTDDQGWRIEIKKYPKLTEVGAWRNGSEYGPYSDRTFDSTRYGGFYTQEQLREVVAYAQERHITVVPEIEMPGHSLAALAAYPELSCTGGSFEVAKGWGVFDDVFCPKDETFSFLENVLTEVIDLFPGEYIHIGGDECPKERWKTCAHCQALMKREGLKDESELQSYFIRRIEKFVNSKGRKIIGWDEILEGGLAPNAAVMSWRGTEGGTTAAKEKHNVVMSPGTHCYFDHYQGDPVNEPLAIGGFTTVQKTYSYEPVPDGLGPEEAKYIMGAQGNVWTEYITTPEQVEYMALPRMIALAEVLWSPKGAHSEDDFVRRLEYEFLDLDAMKVNYSRSLYNVGYTLRGSKKRGQVNVDLSAASGLGEIRYTLDGSEPTIASPQFLSTIEQRESATIKSVLFRGERKMGNTTSRSFSFDKGTGRIITIEPAPSDRYDDGGPFALVDGISAGDRRVNPEWLGWTSPVITITVDLGVEQPLSHIGIGALEEQYSWIHPPAQVEISTSTSGSEFAPLGTVKRPPDAKGRTDYSVDKNVTARFVRFAVKSIGTIPEGLAGAGHAPWIFLDEVHLH